MKWTIDEAVELLTRSFPGMMVTIEDGDNDYLVGTVEDADEIIQASFWLSLDTSGKVVTEIRIGQGDKFCGIAAQPGLGKSSRHSVPIQITRQNENGSVWGTVGDYEIYIQGGIITERSSFSDGN